MIAVVDIGGTNTRVAVYKEKSGKAPVAKTSFSTVKANPKQNFLQITNFVKRFQNVQILVMSFPGVATKNMKKFGVLVNLPKWSNFNFYNLIKTETQVTKIVMENDANLMALSNHHFFKQGKGDITQFFTISTGLGAGLIINNQIFKGVNSWAQEIANLPTAWSSEQGKNLGEGSVEYFSSGSGLLVRAHKQGLKIQNTEELFGLHTKGNDVKAKKIINEGVEALANLIAITCATVNPNLVVFDGSVARHNNWYVEKAVALSKTRMFPKQFQNTKFQFAKLGDDSALLGAYFYGTRNFET